MSGPKESRRAWRRRIVVFSERASVLECAQAILEAAGCEMLPAHTLAELEIHRLYSDPEAVLVDSELAQILDDELDTVVRALGDGEVRLRLIPSCGGAPAALASASRA